LTLFEIDKLIADKDAKVTGAKQVVFIQCVGSREPERPYCSRLCCTHSVESAIELKRLNPEMDVVILYREMRTYGDKELLYKEAREAGGHVHPLRSGQQAPGGRRAPTASSR
jgi:heterodisulfide reductase subunit A2